MLKPCGFRDSVTRNRRFLRHPSPVDIGCAPKPNRHLAPQVGSLLLIGQQLEPGRCVTTPGRQLRIVVEWDS
jgi:hypothetical protein